MLSQSAWLHLPCVCAVFLMAAAVQRCMHNWHALLEQVVTFNLRLSASCKPGGQRSLCSVMLATIWYTADGMPPKCSCSQAVSSAARATIMVRCGGGQCC